MHLLIKNIKGLLQTRANNPKLLYGNRLEELPLEENAYLLIEDEKIAEYGAMEDCPERADKEIDATGRYVFPCWCDSHTHLVYAGSRESEFVDKIKGLSYEEIAQQGGGILNSAKRLNEASEQELLEPALKRLEEIKDFGTGAVEIKSGYALTVEGELKMLRVIKKLKEKSPLTIKSTFLGAHAIPLEYKGNRDEYIDLIINKMLPKVHEEGLADYFDVFCDRGFFTREETERLLDAAEKYDFTHKIHGNELGQTGGVQASIDHQALTVDHLESAGDEEIALLANSKTIPTILPSVAFYLNLDYAPARKIIDSGCSIALATDYNPGSSPSGNFPFTISLACIKLGMLPEEAINAATINGSYAMEVNEELGSITPGKKANVFITKELPSYEFLPYAFGSQHVDEVIINGKIT